MNDKYADLRDEMVRRQIAARTIEDKRVLAAMLTVPRHLFVPEELREEAYGDGPLPIGYGQTISQPYIVALMTEKLEVGMECRVLEIGAGSGYQTAVLAELAFDVHSVEIVPELVAMARKNLARAGYENVRVRQGDGGRGLPELAPFTRILVAATAEEVPAELLAQLAPGGRMILPLASGGDQELVLLRKAPDGAVERESHGLVRFVPLVGGEGGT